MSSEKSCSMPNRSLSSSLFVLFTKVQMPGIHPLEFSFSGVGLRHPTVVLGMPGLQGTMLWSSPLQAHQLHRPVPRNMQTTFAEVMGKLRPGRVRARL